MGQLPTAQQVRRSTIGALLAGLIWPIAIGAAEPATPGRSIQIPVSPIATVRFRQPGSEVQGVDSLEIGQPPAPLVDDPPGRREADCRTTAGSKRLHDVNIDIRPAGELLPPDCSGDLFTRGSLEYVNLRRNSAITPFGWEASGICLRPTYFDDVPLERYGQTIHRAAQPIVSSAHFFATVPLLPYRMTLAPPHDCRYTLGYHRPGDAAPCYYPWLPWDTRAALVEAATIAGFVLIVP